MRKATLTTNPSTDDGTFGKLILDDGTVYFTGENIWADNQPGVSCILPAPKAPSITYLCRWFNSPKHGWCYLITGTEGRSMCEIHSANFMGDPSKGKVDQLLGCIALGMALGRLEPVPGSEVFQMAVLRSKDAIKDFDDNLNGDDLELTIFRN